MIVIIGLGETGVSCVEYFQKRQQPVFVLDSRENPSKLADFKARFPDVVLQTGRFSKDILSQADKVVISPGISKDHPDILESLNPKAKIMGDIELFAQEVTAPVVAITGSNGKSTVTTLLGEMAKKTYGIDAVGVGGNLGKPALTLLNNQNKIYILELSSFQLETTYSLKPVVATVLNLSPDHLDRYNSIEDYRLAKLRIYQGAQKIVFNRADAVLPDNSMPLNRTNSEKINKANSLQINRSNGQQIDKTNNEQINRLDIEQDLILTEEKKYSIIDRQYISFGLDTPLENQYGLIYLEKPWLARGEERLIAVDDLLICGRHNVANALAALALGECIGLPMADMLSVLKTFKGLEHRCEWVRDYQGVKWVNDSKGTNVGASVAALEGLSSDITGKWVLIAGGVGKNADFTPLVPLVEKHCRAVVLIGEAADKLNKLFSPIIACFKAQNMEEAVQMAAKKAKSGDGVLLSPACASLDMFRDFAERGNVFKSVVLELV